MAVGVLFFVAGMGARKSYVNALGPDPVTAALASDYLQYFIPAMSLQFAIVAMGAALRGTGNFRPGMIVHVRPWIGLDGAMSVACMPRTAVYKRTVASRSQVANARWWISRQGNAPVSMFAAVVDMSFSF